jgi:hypothetical protein
MEYPTYRNQYFAQPFPIQRYQFCGSFGVTLYFETYQKAVAYYSDVLGSPAYIEGSGTHGWQIGKGWLTLLKGKNGNPQNVEITFEVSTIQQAEKLQQAFIDSGGNGSPPTNEIMYTPVRFCPVVDPFGTQILIISQID